MVEKLLNSPAFVAMISTIGTVAVAYITSIWAKHRRITKKPDRTDTIFDGYERLILQQQSDARDKQHVITTLETAVKKLERQLADTKELLEATKEELRKSQDQTRAAQEAFDEFRQANGLKKSQLAT